MTSPPTPAPTPPAVPSGLYDGLAAAIRAERPAALATVIAGPGKGAKLLVEPGTGPQGTLGNADLDRVVVRDALGELAAGTTVVRHYGEHGEAREAVVADWAGGTRLGDGLRRFNDRWGVRGLARGAVVVVLSDGWDRGDPAVLGTELGRLRRVAHRLVWVNPLKASPGYAPLAQGMAAALPHVDEFLEGHSVASLEALAEVVAR